MDLSTTLVICLTATVIALTFLYRYFTKHFGYWESQGVATEKAYPIVGTELSLFKKPVHEIDIDRNRKYGKIFGGYFLTQRLLYVFDPEIIKLILVKDFHFFVNRIGTRSGSKLFDIGLAVALDDHWKKIRSIMSPTFSSGKLKKMTFLFKEIAKEKTKNVLKLAEKGDPVDMKEEFSKYSIEVIGACVFGIRFDSFANPKHPFILNTKRFTEGGLLVFLVFFYVGIIPQIFKLIKEHLLKLTGINFFYDAAREIIQERRKTPLQKKVDFLQLMLDAKEEDMENSEPDKKDMTANNFDNKTKHSISTKKLSEDEIVSQCATFLAGGHDTVASTVSYAAFDLALNLDAQEKLHREIDDAFEKHGEIDYDTINQMPYLHAVVSETLRLHTIGIRSVRQAKEDYQIPNTNIIIPKDTTVFIPLYALHHNAEYFPDPEKFDPDRFLPENKDSIVPYSYIPFGDGPRNCIAMRFALINVKFCLAYFLRYIKFCPTEETKKPLKYFLGSQVLTTKNGIIVRLEKRRNFE